VAVCLGSLGNLPGIL